MTRSRNQKSGAYRVRSAPESELQDEHLPADRNQFSPAGIPKRCSLGIIETVVRHRGLGIVDPRIAKPRLQPCGFYFVPDAGQLRADVTANQDCHTFCPAWQEAPERSPTGASRGIGRRLRRKPDRVALHRSAVGNREHRHIAGIVITQLEIRHCRRGCVRPADLSARHKSTRA